MIVALGKLSISIVLAVTLPAFAMAASIYETPVEFVNRAFSNSPPEPRVVWLSGERKVAVQQLLGHDYPTLRLRYWCQAGRSAWVLEELGKELPITVGIIIAKDFIKSLQVLIYRENRGGEVATPAFTDQFNGNSLNAEGEFGKAIDGISGATLSVRALTRLAKMALFLHSDTGCNNGT